MNKEIISFNDFVKLDLRIGTILEAEPVQNSTKLLKLLVDIDDPSTSSGLGKRQIIAGIQKSYTPESLIGKQIVIIANLEPKKLADLESQGMLLAAHNTDGLPIILQPEKTAPNGSVVS